jgi:hypothetical protein
MIDFGNERPVTYVGAELKRVMDTIQADPEKYRPSEVIPPLARAAAM